MFPWKKILCPTDFSEASLPALKTAGEAAGHFSAELVALHVIAAVPILPTDYGPVSFDIPEYEKEMRVNSEKRLEEVIHTQVEHPVQCRTRISTGDAAVEIVRVAEEEGVDVIIIATHGLTGWRRFVAGSVTEKVVRTAQCPVLTLQTTRPDR